MRLGAKFGGVASERQEVLNAVGLVVTERQIIPSATATTSIWARWGRSCVHRASVRTKLPSGLASTF